MKTEHLLLIGIAAYFLLRKKTQPMLQQNTTNNGGGAVDSPTVPFVSTQPPENERSDNTGILADGGSLVSYNY